MRIKSIFEMIMELSKPFKPEVPSKGQRHIDKLEELLMDNEQMRAKARELIENAPEELLKYLSKADICKTPNGGGIITCDVCVFNLLCVECAPYLLGERKEICSAELARRETPEYKAQQALRAIPDEKLTRMADSGWATFCSVLTNGSPRCYECSLNKSGLFRSDGTCYKKLKVEYARRFPNGHDKGEKMNTQDEYPLTLSQAIEAMQKREIAQEKSTGHKLRITSGGDIEVNAIWEYWGKANFNTLNINDRFRIVPREPVETTELVGMFGEHEVRVKRVDGKLVRDKVFKDNMYAAEKVLVCHKRNNIVDESTERAIVLDYQPLRIKIGCQTVPFGEALDLANKFIKLAEGE